MHTEQGKGLYVRSFQKDGSEVGFLELTEVRCHRLCQLPHHANSSAQPPPTADKPLWFLEGHVQSQSHSLEPYQVPIVL